MINTEKCSYMYLSTVSDYFLMTTAYPLGRIETTILKNIDINI